MATTKQNQNASSKAKKETANAEKATQNAENKKMADLEKMIQAQQKQIEDLKQKAQNKPTIEQAETLMKKKEEAEKNLSIFNQHHEALSRIDADLSDSPLETDETLMFLITTGESTLFKSKKTTVLNAVINGILREIEKRQKELNEEVKKIDSYFA